jgi:hypothetical protein
MLSVHLKSLGSFTRRNFSAWAPAMTKVDYFIFQSKLHSGNGFLKFTVIRPYFSFLGHGPHPGPVCTEDSRIWRQEESCRHPGKFNISSRIIVTWIRIHSITAIKSWLFWVCHRYFIATQFWRKVSELLASPLQSLLQSRNILNAVTASGEIFEAALAQLSQPRCLQYHSKWTFFQNKIWLMAWGGGGGFYFCF